MIVRQYTDADWSKLKALHDKQGFDYPFPPVLSGQDFVSHRIIEDHTGIGMGCFLRKTAEVYLICNPEWRTPAWRNEAVRKLHITCNDDAREAGVVDVIAFLPPPVVEAFGKRLRKYGWQRGRKEWAAYSREVT